MISIKDFNFSGKKAIVRVDFNVPLDKNQKITDDTRIRAALPTIKKIVEDGGSAVLMSHLGRPKGSEDKFSLRHIVGHLTELLGREVKFADDCIGNQTLNAKNNLQSGDVLLLENLRFYKEEKKGNADFAKKLAEGIDVYVNDAFGTAHRAHASTAVIAQFFESAKMFGFLIKRELTSIDKISVNPRRPFTAIMGGAKVSDKIQIINNLLDKVDNLIIGGGMIYTFVKAQGGNVGNSICEDDKTELALEVLKKAKTKGVKVWLPVDNVVANEFSNDAKTQLTSIDAVPEGWMGLDIGTKTIDIFKSVIMKSSAILWNGPMGVFEMSNFQEGTKKIAVAIAESTERGAFSLIGGGDSVAAINKFELTNSVSYISTGGGALLEYIEGKELPGVTAIRK